MRAPASEHFGAGLEALFTKIFAGMMEGGSLKRADPVMLAFVYTAPISSLVQLCDREPQRRGEAMKKIEAFIGHFIETYGGKHEKLH